MKGTSKIPGNLAQLVALWSLRQMAIGSFHHPTDHGTYFCTEPHLHPLKVCMDNLNCPFSLGPFNLLLKTALPSRI
jgi:hypothetical protein